MSHPDGPPAYFKPLERLWDEKRGRAEAFAWKDRSVIGGSIAAAVMFIDMSGFSKLVARHRKKPHAAAFVACHHLGLLESWCKGPPGDAINRAYLAKIIGDEVMLVIPGQRVQAVTDAVSLASRATVRPIYQCKVGIHWGQVWLGDIGIRCGGNRYEDLREVTVMGDVVNIAARLVQCRKGHPLEIRLLVRDIDGGTGPLDQVMFPPSLATGVDHVPLKGVATGKVPIHVLTQSVQLPGGNIDVVGDYLKAVPDVPSLD